MVHSTLTNPQEHGRHDGYKPGQYDPTTGITNPEQRGYVRGFNRKDSIYGPGGFLATLTPFTSHSIRAIRETHEDGSFTYTVFSYATDIASWHMPKYDANNPGRDTPVVQVSMEDYGQTTRIHQNACNAWLGHAIDRNIAATIFGD